MFQKYHKAFAQTFPIVIAIVFGGAQSAYAATGIPGIDTISTLIMALLIGIGGIMVVIGIAELVYHAAHSSSHRMGMIGIIPLIIMGALLSAGTIIITQMGLAFGAGLQ